MDLRDWRVGRKERIVEKIKTLKEFKKQMNIKAEEIFEEICQIVPEFKSLLTINIVKEAILTGYIYGLYEGTKQARIKIDKLKKKK